MKRLLLLTLLLISYVAPAVAQDDMPEPHLGYGLHLDPNVPVDPALVSNLGMDWVKLYADHQIPLFPDKRILYRQDMGLPTDWEDFRRWVAERARVLSAEGVEAIEIHNEPNLRLEWGGRTPNAREYVQMLREAYLAVKSVAPNMIVVSGGLAPTVTTADRRAISDLEFARQMFENGAARWFDAFGYHPYGYNAPPEAEPGLQTLNFRRTELIYDLMLDYGITDKQVWLTEFGWLRDPAEDGVSCSDNDPEFAGFAWLRVDGETQANYIARAFAYADRHWPWAGPTFLWNLNFSQRPNDGSLARCSHMRWFGLLKQDGSPTPALQRVASMPKRYSRYTPTMKLYADSMTLDIPASCFGEYEVGEFNIGNTGYPGTFTAQIKPARAPQGPRITVSAETAQTGEDVTVFAQTEGLDAGLYLVYINVRTTIRGALQAQNLRGFVILRDDPAAVCPQGETDGGV